MTSVLYIHGTFPSSNQPTNDQYFPKCYDRYKQSSRYREHFFPLKLFSCCWEMSWNNRWGLTWGSASHLLHRQSSWAQTCAMQNFFISFHWAEKANNLGKRVSKHTRFCQLPTRFHVTQSARSMNFRENGIQPLVIHYVESPAKTDWKVHRCTPKRVWDGNICWGFF